MHLVFRLRHSTQAFATIARRRSDGFLVASLWSIPTNVLNMVFGDILLNGETSTYPQDSNIEDPGPRMQELGTSKMTPFNADSGAERTDDELLQASAIAEMIGLSVCRCLDPCGLRIAYP
jgi:hypothetical protein